MTSTPCWRRVANCLAYGSTTSSFRRPAGVRISPLPILTTSRCTGRGDSGMFIHSARRGECLQRRAQTVAEGIKPHPGDR